MKRTRQAPGVDTWAMLLSSGRGFLLIGDVLDWLFEHGYAAAQAGAPAGTLATLAGNAVAHIVRLAEEMRSGHRLRVADPPDANRGNCAVSTLEPIGAQAVQLAGAVAVDNRARIRSRLAAATGDATASPGSAGPPTLRVNSTSWWR